MAQVRGPLTGGIAPRARAKLPPEAPEPPKLILCVLPRRFPANPLEPLLRGNRLEVADSWTRTLAVARRSPCDLYIVYSPLNWADAGQICRRIRSFDAHTPVILHSTAPNAAERGEMMAAAVRYVGRSDDAHNLAGTAGQLIMLAELRSMEAVISGAPAIEERIARWLSRQRRGESVAQVRLKLEVRRIFTQAGGSRANFERMWPSIFQRALERIARSSS